MIPLQRSGRKVVIAMANPINLEGAKAMEFAFSAPIEITIAEEAKIIEKLEQLID